MISIVLDVFMKQYFTKCNICTEVSRYLLDLAQLYTGPDLTLVSSKALLKFAAPPPYIPNFPTI